MKIIVECSIDKMRIDNVVRIKIWKLDGMCKLEIETQFSWKNVYWMQFLLWLFENIGEIHINKRRLSKWWRCSTRLKSPSEWFQSAFKCIEYLKWKKLQLVYNRVIKSTIIITSITNWILIQLFIPLSQEVNLLWTSHRRQNFPNCLPKVRRSYNRLLNG